MQYDGVAPARTIQRAALFGMGAIGASLAAEWTARPPAGWVLASVCARARQVDGLRAALPAGTAVVTSLPALLAQAPDAVVEAAGHASAREAAGAVLRAGVDFYLLSSGILAEREVFDSLLKEAARGRASLVIPCGALAGFDGLAAIGRLDAGEVLYRSTKPAKAWRGTPAEDVVDLDGLTERTLIYRGTAREAAKLFPQNANLAASVAVAGVGFDRTQVELVADPRALRNSAEIEARAPNCELRVQLSSLPEARNPRSSAIVRTSVLAALERSTGAIRLG